jgi:hypothetical protein
VGGLGQFFSRLFGGGSGQTRSADGGIYVRVQCAACGEVIQARINPTSELSQDDDGGGYYVRKVLVGQQCFRPIELQMRYADLRGTVLSQEVRGGTIVE